MGGRLARGSSLSDEKVIDLLNKEFVVLDLNVTDGAWPKELPGLNRWEAAWRSDWRYQYAFTTQVVVSPDGTRALGTAGCGHEADYETAIQYHPDRYLPFLQETLERSRRLGAIEADPTLSAEERRKKLSAIDVEAFEQVKKAAACKLSEKWGSQRQRP
jgi:hypothetical protein